MTNWLRDERATTRTAVLGTGRTGTSMACRLLGAGMQVDVWSHRPESTMGLVDAGATAYLWPDDACSRADVVLSTLPTVEATVEVMVDQLALCGMRPGAIWVQVATIDVESTEWLAPLVRSERRDVSFVDARVVIDQSSADADQLVIMASGPESVASRLAPVFDVLGRATVWLGRTDAGNRMKLVLDGHTEERLRA